MKILKKILLCLLMISSQGQAIYIVEGDDSLIEGGIVRSQDKPSALCKVEITGGGYGTGTFVSQNVVLTCAHNLEEGEIKDQLTLAPCHKISVTIGDEVYPVVECLLFRNSRLIENIALLILDRNINEIRPAKVKSYDGNILERFKIFGYGMGELINPEPIDKEDIVINYKNFLKNSVNFWPLRSVTVAIDDKNEKLRLINPVTNSILPRIEFLSKCVKLASGDSGGPLIDQEDNIIGIIETGNKKLGEMIKENNKKISNSIDSLWIYFYITKWHSLKESSFSEAFIHHRKQLWFELKLAFEQGKYFSSSFQALTPEAVKWIEKVIADNKLMLTSDRI